MFLIKKPSEQKKMTKISADDVELFLLENPDFS